MVLRVTRIGENLFNGGLEYPPNRGRRGITLHRPDDVRVGRSLELVFGDFLNAIDETSTRGAIEEGLGIGWTELEIGDDFGLRHPDWESFKPCRGANGLAMTGDERGMLGHWAHPPLLNIKTREM